MSVDDIRVTQGGVYLETEWPDAIVVTQGGVYIETGPSDVIYIRASLVGAYVEAEGQDVVEVTLLAAYVEVADQLQFKLIAAAAAASATPDACTLLGLVTLQAAAAAASATPAATLIPSTLACEAAASAASAAATPKIEFVVPIAAAASAQIVTADQAAATVRAAAAANAAAVSTTRAASLQTAPWRAHAALASAAAPAAISVVYRPRAAAVAASASANALLANAYHLAATAHGASTSAVAVVYVPSWIAAAAQAGTATGAAEMRTPLLVTGGSAAASASAAITWTIRHNLAVPLMGLSSAAAPILAVQRPLRATSAADSASAAIALASSTPLAAAAAAMTATPAPLLDRQIAPSAAAAAAAQTHSAFLARVWQGNVTAAAVSVGPAALISIPATLHAAGAAATVTAIPLLRGWLVAAAAAQSAVQTADGAILRSLFAASPTALSAASAFHLSLLRLRRARVITGTDTAVVTRLSGVFHPAAAASASSATGAASLLPSGVLMEAITPAASSSAAARLAVNRSLQAAAAGVSAAAQPQVGVHCRGQASAAAASATGPAWLDSIVTAVGSVQANSATATLPVWRTAAAAAAAVTSQSASAIVARFYGPPLTILARSDSAAAHVALSVQHWSFSVQPTAVSATAAPLQVQIAPPFAVQIQAASASATAVLAVLRAAADGVEMGTETPVVPLTRHVPLSVAIAAASLTTTPHLFVSATGEMGITQVAAYVETLRAHGGDTARASAVLGYVEQTPARAAQVSSVLGYVEQRPAAAARLSAVLGYAELRPDQTVRMTRLAGYAEATLPDRARATAVRGYVELRAANTTVRATRLAGYVEIAVPRPVVGGTYYVRQSGNDAADGTTPATAFRTVQRAVNAAAPGDTIYVGAGVYHEVVILPVSGVLGGSITLHGDFTGEHTGDAGLVVLSAMPQIGDRYEAGYRSPLITAGHRFWTFRQLHYAGSGHRSALQATSSGVVAIEGSDTNHEGILFEDCVFTAAASEYSNLPLVHVAYATVPDTPATMGPLFRRCVFSGAGSTGLKLDGPVPLVADVNLKMRLEGCLFFSANIHFACAAGGGYRWGGLDIVQTSFVGVRNYVILVTTTASTRYPIRYGNCLFLEVDRLFPGATWGSEIVDIGGNFQSAFSHQTAKPAQFSDFLPILLGGVIDWPLRRVWGQSPWRPFEPIIFSPDVQTSHLAVMPALMPKTDLYGEVNAQAGGLVPLHFGTSVSGEWWNLNLLIDDDWDSSAMSNVSGQTLVVNGLRDPAQLPPYPIKAVHVAIAYRVTGITNEIGYTFAVDGQTLSSGILTYDFADAYAAFTHHVLLAQPAGGWTPDKLGRLTGTFTRLAGGVGQISRLYRISLGVEYVTGVSAAGAVFPRARKWRELAPVYEGGGKAITLHGAGTYMTQRGVKSASCTVAVWAYYDSTYNGAPPALEVTTPYTGATQRVTMTAPAETWQQLSLTVDVPHPGPLVVRLVSYDASQAGKTIFDELTVEQPWL